MDFQQVEAEYRKLKAQFDAGQLSEEELRSRVTQFVVEDDQGRWWSIGYETGQWYYHDGENWTPGTPPAAAAAPTTSQASPAPLAPEPDKSETLEPVSLAVEPRRDGAARRNLPYLWIAGAIIIVGIFAVLLPQITGGKNNNGQMAQVSATPTEKVETGVQPVPPLTVLPSATTPPAAPPSATATATPPLTDQPTATPTLTDRPTVTPTPTKPPTATASPTSRPTATSTPPRTRAAWSSPAPGRMDGATSTPTTCRTANWRASQKRAKTIFLAGRPTAPRLRSHPTPAAVASFSISGR